MWNDLRFGARGLVRSPGFTMVVGLSLALGVGLNTTVFSAIDAVLWRPLPVRDPANLVSVLKVTEGRPPRTGHSMPDYLDYAANTKLFRGAVAYSRHRWYVGSWNDAQRVRGEAVTLNYFEVLGVSPILGRPFAASDANENVALISERLWRGRFLADPEVVGRQVTVSGQPCTVIGVVPAKFSGIELGPGTDVYLPMHLLPKVSPDADLNERGNRLLSMAARLQAGVSAEQAKAAIEAQSLVLEKTYPDTNTGIHATVEGAALVPPEDRGGAKQVALLFGPFLLVLLIACANAASLMLGRAATRQREIGVRLALGASRKRLVRQLLTESLLLAVFAGVAGFWASLWGAGLLEWLAGRLITDFGISFAPDYRVLLFTVGLSLVTAVLFGLAPAWHASRTNLVSTIRSEGLATTPGAFRTRLRSALVVSQVVLSMLLLVATGLLTRAAIRAQQTDPGIDTTRLVMLPLDLRLYGYDEATGPAFLDRTIEEVQGLSEVERASLAATVPFGDNYSRTSAAPDQTREPIVVSFNAVSPGHFETIGIELAAGRDFTPRDTAASTPVAIVNEELAKRFWPGGNPVGQSLRLGDRVYEVVGVSQTIMYRSLGEPPDPHMFVPLSQDPRLDPVLLVRTRGDGRSALGAIRERVRSLDDRVQVMAATALRDRVEEDLAGSRFAAGLFAGLAALALVLAGIGMYGVVAYSVSQRTREIGLRVALGARKRDVVGMVLRQGLRLGLTGAVLGIGLALVLARLITSMLNGVSPADPVTYASVAVVLLGVVMLASYFPARRAAGVDPLSALRHD